MMATRETVRELGVAVLFAFSLWALAMMYWITAGR